MGRRSKKSFETAALAHQSAQKKFAQAEVTYGRATKEFEEAARIAARAQARWRLFQHLVVIAASLDAASLNASRSLSNATQVNCSDGMSTAAYRALLSAGGVAIAGMDVDHIVPRPLGGADHPGNYQLLPSSVNRSLGKRGQVPERRGSSLREGDRDVENLWRVEGAGVLMQDKYRHRQCARVGLRARASSVLVRPTRSSPV